MTKHNEDFCENYELRLADAAELAAERGEQIALSTDLSAHVSSCTRCSDALDAISVSRSLLLAGFEPTEAPSPFFAKRVMATIRSEEAQRAQSSPFWSPLQHLAARIAMGAGIAVILLSGYAYSSSVSSTGADTSGQNAAAYELVPHQQLDPQPQSKDEVLMSLVERSNAR
ncbi:MAG TPA: hypothetical protein VIH72_15485 [Candidatus Acidoferrales bacterium]